jgi:predicted 3-demethylubiquinone-9 3-methyltransferase (glyoxalase superfamily)
VQQRITTNLWFDDQAEEAAEYYCSIWNDSETNPKGSSGDEREARGRIVSKAHYPEGSPVGQAGTVMVVEWELDGQRFVGINGGPQFTFSEAISLQVNCETQEEIDYYWERLIADGGEEGPCGWCKDKYGLSWQVTPRGMDELFADPDKSKAQRAFQAMMGMKKLDIAELRRAADGVPA